MSYFVGLDVSLRAVSVCIIDQEGLIVLEQSVDCEAETINICLHSFKDQITKVGFEAGVMSQTLFYGLQELGYDVVCMEARHVSAALSAMRNKTDKNDARGIAQVVRSGWYRPVHMKSRDAHYIRALLSSRKAVLSKCVDLENEIRGLLRAFGVRLPAPLGHHRFEQTVLPIIAADEGLSFALMPMLEARAVLYTQYRELDKRAKMTARQDPVCNLLMTTPGVGAMTALHFKAAIDKPERFKSSRTVAAHFGLTPRRFQSGEMDHSGRISRAGDTDVRASLYSAANSLLTRTKHMSPLKSWGLRLVKRRGRKRGTVAVARKLAVILHRMWVDGTPYRWSDMEVAS